MLRAEIDTQGRIQVFNLGQAFGFSDGRGDARERKRRKEELLSMSVQTREQALHQGRIVAAASSGGKKGNLTGSTFAVVAVDVHPDGRVVFADGSRRAAGSLYLDSISFKLAKMDLAKEGGASKTRADDAHDSVQLPITHQGVVSTNTAPAVVSSVDHFSASDERDRTMAPAVLSVFGEVCLSDATPIVTPNIVRNRAQCIKLAFAHSNQDGGAFFQISANSEAALDVGGGGGDRKRVFLTRARETSHSRKKSKAALWSIEPIGPDEGGDPIVHHRTEGCYSKSTQARIAELKAELAVIRAIRGQMPAASGEEGVARSNEEQARLERNALAELDCLLGETYENGRDGMLVRFKSVAFPGLYLYAGDPDEGLNIDKAVATAKAAAAAMAAAKKEATAAADAGSSKDGSAATASGVTKASLLGDDTPLTKICGTWRHCKSDSVVVLEDSQFERDMCTGVGGGARLVLSRIGEGVLRCKCQAREQLWVLQPDGAFHIWNIPAFLLWSSSWSSRQDLRWSWQDQGAPRHCWHISCGRKVSWKGSCRRQGARSSS